MLGFLAFITGLSGPIQYITGKLADLGIAKSKASTDQEKIKIDAAIQEAHDRRAILVAEAGSRLAGTLNASVRLLLALAPLVIIWKLMIWDKVIGSFAGCAGITGPECVTFNTDKLDPNQWLVITAVIAFYFGYDMIARFRR